MSTPNSRPVKLRHCTFIAEYSYLNGNTCGVCQKSLQVPASQTSLVSENTIGECEHVFHKDCIANWSKINPVCPVCKAPYKLLISDIDKSSYDKRLTGGKK